MKLAIPFTEFKETINKYVAEGDPLTKNRITTEEELAKSKEELKDWENRSFEFLKTAFGESNNYLINEFRSAGGNRFHSTRTDFEYRKSEHQEIFKETVSELAYCLKLASISDPLVFGDSYDSKGRDSFTQDEKILFFLRKLNQINTGGYHPIKYLFESNEVRLNHHDEIRELAKILDYNGVIELHPGLGTFHAKITAAGVHALQEIERESSKDEPIQQSSTTNIVNIHSMVNSSVQQGSIDSSQIITVNSAEGLNELKLFLLELRQSIDALSLSAELRDEIIAEIETAEVQTKSPKPKGAIIKETLKTIRTILEGVSISALSPQFIEKAKSLIDFFQ